jgi:dTMP kinase
MLYAADRGQHVEEVIKPALAEGKWVLCDRFSDATAAYQGRGRGQDLELIALLNKMVTQGIRPDMTFLLDCPVEIGLERAIKRNQGTAFKGQDRFERENLDFHIKVREGYLLLAREEPQRFALIDATRKEDQVEDAIFQHLEPFVIAVKGQSRR